MTSPVTLSRIHHVAYRCKDAKETVEWYARVLGMDYTTAFAEDHVPSTGEYDPYMHIFLDAGGGNVLAFFELPNQPDMGRDPNTPAWVQHLAFEVPDLDSLMAAKAHIEAQGIDVIGGERSAQPTDMEAIVKPQLDRAGNMNKGEYDLFVADLVNYLTYMGEPAREQRTQIGILALFFLVIAFFAALLLKHEYWKDVR